MLLARFDRAALSVAPPAGYRAAPLRGEQLAAAQWLEDWCFEAGPFAVARLAGPAGSGRSHLAETFSRRLDGDEGLQALPAGWPRLRLRLAVKIAEHLPGRARRRGDPWDCGMLPGTDAALQALQRFVPRRPTLMVADELPPPVLGACTAALAPRAAAFGEPVRLLVIERAERWSLSRA